MKKDPTTGADNFRPIDPWKSDDLSRRRRNLPHLEVAGATYFVTFRCRPGVALSPDERDIVMAAITICDRREIELDAAVVMPNHVHAIFRLIGSAKMSRLLQRIKGRSARMINRSRGQTGASLWADESFDHIVRHGTEWEEKIEYLRLNPLRRALVERPEDYQWLFVRKITG
jgi:REP-associated tyrosine transposase